MTQQEWNDAFVFILRDNEDAAISWCKTVGLLPNERISLFGNTMYEIKRKTQKARGYFIRCPLKSCRKDFLIRKGSFFEGSNLPIGKILMIMYNFVQGETKFTSFKRKWGISTNKTIVDWLSFCREIYVLYFL
jgi:hypothetical protein